MPGYLHVPEFSGLKGRQQAINYMPAEVRGRLYPAVNDWALCFRAFSPFVNSLPLHLQVDRPRS